MLVSLPRRNGAALLQEQAMTGIGLTMGGGELHFLSREQNAGLLELAGFKPEDALKINIVSGAVSIANLMGEAIDRIAKEESISVLFESPDRPDLARDVDVAAEFFGQHSSDQRPHPVFQVVARVVVGRPEHGVHAPAQIAEHRPAVALQRRDHLDHA